MCRPTDTVPIVTCMPVLQMQLQSNVAITLGLRNFAQVCFDCNIAMQRYNLATQIGLSHNSVHAVYIRLAVYVVYICWLLLALDL
jgi:uncharacterized membrane protein YciS (DUF1049 family)